MTQRPQMAAPQQRAWTFSLLLALLLLLGPWAAKPTGAQPALEAARVCTVVRNDSDRLRCYDRALGVEPDAQRRVTDGDRDEGREATRSAEAARAAEAAPAQPSTRERTSGVREPPAPRSAAPAAAAPPAAPARTVELSRDRDSAADAEDDPVRVTVVDVRTDPTPNATFITDDGQVWRQTDGRRSRLPDTPFAAEIRPGSLGSFFLRPLDNTRALRVRRER